MDIGILFTLLMFGSLFGFLMLGFPVAFTLAGTGVIFGIIGILTGTLDATFLEFFPNRIFDNVIRNELLFAVPLFIMMGITLEKSKVAEDLLDSMGQLFGSLPGGLGISVTIVGALLAASTGIVGATVVTMGLLSLPTMLRRGYDPALATGIIASSGTLGQIIPPSIVLILLADVMSSSWQQAQLSNGIFSPTPMSAGELFAGALVPGVILVGLYISYQIFVAFTRPERCPAVEKSDDQHLDQNFYKKLLMALVPPLALIISVLGSILSGIATPTEAASVGAIGALLLGAIRMDSDHAKYFLITLAALLSLLVIANVADLRMDLSTVQLSDKAAFGLAILLTLIFAAGLLFALRKSWQSGVLHEILTSTVRMSTMIYAILIGASLFSLVFRGFGGDEAIEHLLTNLPGGQAGALIAVMLVMFILGFFLDFIEITFVVVPIVAPALLAMDGTLGPIWLGVMMAMNLQTSFLTPPFGFALFYLRGVAPDSVKTSAMYRGVLPFIIIQIIGLLLLVVFPELTTWLPSKLFG